MGQAQVAGPWRTSQVTPSAFMAKGGSFDQLYVRHPRRWLVVILVGYLVVAWLFATRTPAWQAPDEPAHYNYIAYIAETGSLPVLVFGDYDQRLLVQMLTNGFPDELPVEGLRYESYQPPLYYIVTSPVFLASGGSLTALRLFNALLGLGALLLLYLCLELVFPGKPLLTLGATAFAAFLPMHVAVNSALNNDVLAELLMAAAALVLLHWMRPYFYEDDETIGYVHDRNLLLTLGVLLGLGMLTKIYAYAVLPMFGAVVAWTIWQREKTWAAFARGVGRAIWVAAPAVALAAPMWLRNQTLYGGTDLLGLNWHDRVVVGQVRTADWIAQFGTMAYVERAFGLTFRSFWGVFGWLGVFMDDRIYQAALFFTGILFLGFLWASVRLISGPPDTDMDPFQTNVLALLGLLLVAVAASFVWYNLKFVQHQGRYFLWGMLAIGTVVALGWREVMHPLQGTITGLLAAVLGISLVLGRLIGNDVDAWSVLIVWAMAALLLVQPFLLIGTPYRHPWRRANDLAPWLQKPRIARLVGGLRFLVWAMPFLLLFVLDVTAPYLFILPQLAG